jgi:glycine oxidase
VADNFDLIVVGAGPVGAACARELATTGRRVLLLEQGGDIGQGWRAAAGMLAPQIEAHGADPLLEFGLAGRELYAQLAPALADSTGIDIGLWRGGIAALAASDAEAAALRSRVAWQRQQSHLSDWLDADEVKARWPWLGHTHGALWAPRDGALDPALLLDALLNDARRLGVVMEHETVTNVDREGDHVTGVSGHGGRYAAPDVVIAGGAWSGAIDGLPRPLTVAPVRGQMAALPWPAGARRAIVYGHGGYLLARGEEALVGSTMEYVGFRPTVTREGVAQLLASAGALCPGLAGVRPTRTWAGLRPMTPDGLPVIGREPRLGGLWYATGHGRNGILLAAITGAALRQLVTGETAGDELAPFAPTRFWSW